MAERFTELNRDTGTCQGFYIFIESEVLLACLCSPSGPATDRSWHRVSPHVFFVANAESQTRVSSSCLL